MEINDLYDNISLLLGNQSFKLCTNDGKDIDIKSTKQIRVYKFNKGFNINSLRINYTFKSTNNKINLRSKKVNYTPISRALILAVRLHDKEKIFKAMECLKNATILSIEFNTNVKIIDNYREDESIVPVTLMDHTFYIDYNQDSDYYTYKITDRGIDKINRNPILRSKRFKSRDSDMKYKIKPQYYIAKTKLYGDGDGYFA